MDKEYKLKNHVTKDFLNQTKVDVREWSYEMKSHYQKNLFDFEYYWIMSIDTVNNLHAGFYYTRNNQLSYEDSVDESLFKKKNLKEILWEDLFEAVTKVEELKEEKPNEALVEECLQKVGLEVKEDTSNKPFKSTGGSSKYYEVVLPDWLLDKQKENGYIMIEDLAEIMFNNDFNYTNIFKAQKRMFDLQNGGGKVGNTLEYDANKCKYYVDKQVEVFNRK